ncbi:MAG: LacI family DNA-binding transcriptional regulator [Sneathiellaceae bacterium]
MPVQPAETFLRPRRPSAIQVAQLAGVSQSAVSRAFTPGASISAATRAKVMAAAAELGYMPNAIARSMITRRTNIIGVVLGNLEYQFYQQALRILSLRLQDLGRQMLLFTVPPDGNLDALLPQVLQYQVDGVIIGAATLSSEMAAECERRGTPVVLFNRTVPGVPAHSVTSDNYGGARLVATLLVRAGHRCFGFIAGHRDTSTGINRERGFYEGLRALGVDTDTQVVRMDGRYSYEGAREAVMRLLSDGPRPDAIFGANDMMAMGALDAARAAGIAVPDELSVIGFDDTPQSAWTAYALTTLRQPIEEMVDATIDLIVQLQEQPSNRRTIVEVPVLFVERGSARLPVPVEAPAALDSAGRSAASAAAKPVAKVDRRKGRSGRRRVA